MTDPAQDYTEKLAAIPDTSDDAGQVLADVGSDTDSAPLGIEIPRQVSLPGMPDPEISALIHAFRQRLQHIRMAVHESRLDFGNLRLFIGHQHPNGLNVVHVNHIEAALGAVDYALYTIMETVKATDHQYPHHEVAQ